MAPPNMNGRLTLADVRQSSPASFGEYLRIFTFLKSFSKVTGGVIGNFPPTICGTNTGTGDFMKKVPSATCVH